MIRAQGYVFSSPTSHSDGGLITETITHGHFQGFSASSSAGTNLLKALASERACLVGVACAVGDRILLYRKDFKLLQAHELPIVDPAESSKTRRLAGHVQSQHVLTVIAHARAQSRPMWSHFSRRPS
jgi:hypothetical protein